MRLRFLLVAVTAFGALPWSVTDARAAELGTAPHFLMLADRERIVLFSDGPIAGALADQRADGSIVVTVPKVAAGATIVGREFDDAASGGTGRTKVRVISSAQGDAVIEISGAGPVERVHAYGTTKPARLTIDLLQPGAKERTAEPAVAPAKTVSTAMGEAGAAKGAPATTGAPPPDKAVAAAPTTKADGAKPGAPPVAAAPGGAAASLGAHGAPSVPVPGANAAATVAFAAPAPATTGSTAQGAAPAGSPDKGSTKVVSSVPQATAAPNAPAHAAPAPATTPAVAGSHGADDGVASVKAALATQDAATTANASPAGSSTSTAHDTSATHDAPAAHDAPAVVALAGKDAAPREVDDARDLPAVALATPAPVAAPTPTPSPAANAKDRSKKKGKGASDAVASVPAPSPAASAPAAVVQANASATGQVVPPPTAPSAAAPQALVCRWRRVAGIPYCAPDPKDGIYAADLGTAETAGLLDRARSGPTLVRLPDQGPAEAYLNADVALVRAAKSGYLLPVLVEYERALRTYPNFADARRSRANIALIYHSLGFAPELARLARAQNDPVAPFAGVLLADLWRDREEQHDIAPLLATGRSAGGITNCLAERVAASVAADQGKAAAFPNAFADLSKVCPRTILEDSETAWLRGRALLLGGEAKRAAEVLPLLEEELPRRERPLLLADVVAAQDAAGNVKAARANQERLAGGTLGRRAARGARLALAARDATEGKLGDITGRFADLPMEDAVQTRVRADAIAVGELLRGGKEIAALGMMSERKVDARSLAPADQLLLARALRKVGLLDQARRVLAGVGAATTGRLPDGYYEERGALALAHDDAPGALEVVEEWRAARAGNAPAGAIALKARARAAKGDARGATETLEKELVPLDPALARDVAIDLAGQLRSADPALALRLARGALVEGALPPLEPAREAEALSALADAAEATGDKAAAQAAFTRLASELSGEPAAAGAAYRAARLAAAAPAAAPAPAPASGAAPAPQAVAKAPAAAPVIDDDPLSRRIAAAGQLYQEVVAGMQGAKP